jgi:hypothetical protein
MHLGGALMEFGGGMAGLRWRVAWFGAATVGFRPAPLQFRGSTQCYDAATVPLAGPGALRAKRRPRLSRC